MKRRVNADGRRKSPFVFVQGPWHGVWLSDIGRGTFPPDNAQADRRAFPVDGVTRRWSNQNRLDGAEDALQVAQQLLHQLDLLAVFDERVGVDEVVQDANQNGRRRSRFGE